MAQVRQMNANLVLASGARQDAHQRKFARSPPEAAFDAEFGLRGRAVGSDTIFDRDGAVVVFSQGRIDYSRVQAHASVDDRQVLLAHGVPLPDAAQVARDGVVLGDQHHTAGFAVQTIYQVRSVRRLPDFTGSFDHSLSAD